MASADVRIDIAAQFTGAKAFKQAETASQKLDRSVARLGKQLAGVFAVSKINAYAKASVKAFAEDDKAARALAQTLANTGNAFAALGVEQFIADTQRATGVLDNELRPAFQQLVTVTGNVAKSQQALNLALDISAGTGKSLSAVTAALSKGYAGNTTALSRLGAGLSKATLKSGDMAQITDELSKKFSGQAAVAAEGYSGQLARLTVASENAKEIIGKELLDAMARVSGDQGIGGATTAMEGLATQIGNVIAGTSVLLAQFNKLGGLGSGIAKAINPFGFTGLGALSRLGQSVKTGTPGQSPAQRAAIDRANLKLQKEKNSLAAIDNANTTRKLVLTADQLALQELSKKFDMDRIQIQAALNNTVDQETRYRLNGLMALQDQNGSLAKLTLAQLEAAAAIKAAANGIEADFERMRSAIGAREMAQGSSSIASSSLVTPSSPYYFLSPEYSTEAARSAAGAQQINITLDGQVFQNAVLSATQGGSSNGNTVSYSSLV